MENLPSYEAAQAERVGQERGQVSMQSEQVGQERGQVSMQSEQVGQGRGQVSMQSEPVGQERGQVSMQSEPGVTTASMSVEKMKLLLQKSKSGLNARAFAPGGKRRKSSGRNASLRILSPRTGCSGAVGLGSPMRGIGSLSLSALAQDPSRSRPTRRRKLRSVVWKDFEPIYEGSLIVQAKCNHCLEIFAADRENGRSACHRHLQVCKQRIRMNQMVENMSKGPSYTAKVKSTVNDLFAAYSPETLDSNSNHQTQSNVETIGDDNPWADWEQHLMAQRRNAVKNELEVYLQDDLFPRQKNFDVLQWWMMHSSKYPILSCLARDIFAAPATTVASESAFSTSGRVISDYRSRLTSKNVEALICLQDWLRGEGYTSFKMAEEIDNTEDQYYEITA